MTFFVMTFKDIVSLWNENTITHIPQEQTS